MLKEGMELEAYRDRPDLRLHFQWISAYSSLIERLEVIEAAVLAGSFAKGCPDRISDIDLVVFADEIHFDSASEHLFSLDVFPIVHSFTKEVPRHINLKKLIYENFVSAEVHLFSTKYEFGLCQPYITLKDSNDFLSTKIVDAPPPLHENFPPLNLGFDGLGWELFDLVKWWQRGRRDFVVNHMKKIVRSLEKEESPLCLQDRSKS